MAHVAVFDTNVLFSGVGWKGKPFECLELARTGIVQGLICQEIVDELAEKLELKLRIEPDDVIATIADLLTFLSLVKISGSIKAIIADPEDDKILECAVVGAATHIVTGDRRHLLPLGNFQGVSIVTPAEFVRMNAPP